MTEQTERAEALTALLARQDDDDALRRHTLRWHGDPRRHELLHAQSNVYRAHQLVARENERLQ